jgi:hypothetical protein
VTIQEVAKIILDGGPAVLAVLLLCALCVIWRGREKLLDRVEELHGHIADLQEKHTTELAAAHREHYQEAISYAKTLADVQAKTNQVIGALTAAIGG